MPAGVLTTTTDGSGLYTFTNLMPGVPLTVTFGLPPATGNANPWQPTTSAGMVNDPGNSDMNPVTRQAPPVVLTAGEFNPNIDAGFWQPASLGDRVWLDVDGDNRQTPGEPGIAGVVVTLNSPSTTLTTTTDANGIYTFTGLIPDVPYVVAVTPPAGMQPAQKTMVFNDPNNSDIDPVTLRTDPITVTAGQHQPNIDAGFHVPPGLGDTVWLDVDHDGAQDAGEPVVPGVTVTLFLCGRAGVQRAGNRAEFKRSAEPGQRDRDRTGEFQRRADDGRGAGALGDRVGA